MIRIHKEGSQILIFTLVIFTVTSLLLITFLGNYIGSIVAVLLFVLYFFMFWFFRNPIRSNNASKKDIVAPVDGKVVVIKEVYEKEFLKGQCLQVSIFMSPLNVHVCRYPVSGEIIYTKHHPGKYLVAYHPKSSELNERTTVVAKNGKHDIIFRQIAGRVARRIVLYSKKGDIAKGGDEYGFIKFGSRLDIFLPLDTKLNIKLNDITKGGEQIIGQLPQS